MRYRVTIMRINRRPSARPNAHCRPSGRFLPVFLATLILLVPLADAVAQAQLFVHPTLIMFSGAHRNGTVHVVNQGDATGVFELAWVDFAMTRSGGLSTWDGDAPWSLQPFARFSPRRVTLRPGETQVVRVAVRPGRDTAEGEYYSHLRVVTLERDLDAATAASKTKDTAREKAITIEARTAIAIPVVWRNSDAAPRATIESAEFDPDTNELVVELRRTGELSTRGYVHVFGAAAEGAALQALADPVPVVIYPSIEQRIVVIPLKAVDTGFHAGAEVIYAADSELTSRSSRYATYSIRR